MLTPNCAICDKPAAWIRYTQFAGNHYFCNEHAQKEKDFGCHGTSFFWDILDEFKQFDKRT